MLLEQTEKTGEAFTAYLTAVRNGPMRSQAIDKIQKILEDPKHREACVQAVKSKPELTELASRLFDAIERQDDPLALTSGLLSLRPDDPGAHNEAAWRLATSPDKDALYPHAAQAVEWARRANELAPNDGGLLNTLGVALYRAEQWQEAIDTLQKSIELGADVPHNWLFIAMAHWQLDQKDKAKQWYDKSLAWQTANADAAKADAELQGFFTEAANLMPADAEEPKPNAETEPADGPDKPAGSDKEN